MYAPDAPELSSESECDSGDESVSPSTSISDGSVEAMLFVFSRGQLKLRPLLLEILSI